MDSVCGVNDLLQVHGYRALTIIIEAIIGMISPHAWFNYMLCIPQSVLPHVYVPRFFGNLRNFEIALRILSIAKLRAQFEIAYLLRNLEIE